MIPKFQVEKNEELEGLYEKKTILVLALFLCQGVFTAI